MIMMLKNHISQHLTGLRLVAFATDPKYPRHRTGGFYFDSATVVLHFAALGEPITTPIEVRLRIPLP